MAKLKNIIRWILVLPLGIIAVWLVWIIVEYAEMYIINDLLLFKPLLTVDYIVVIILWLTAPVVFSIVGMRIAPSHKKTTGIILLLLFLLVFIYYVSGGNKDEYFLAIPFLIGLTGSFFLLPKSDPDFERKFK